MKTIEQLCRDILEKAISEDLVIFNSELFGGVVDPQQLTAGDLVGLANFLRDELRRDFVRVKKTSPLSPTPCDQNVKAEMPIITKKEFDKLLERRDIPQEWYEDDED